VIPVVGPWHSTVECGRSWLNHVAYEWRTVGVNDLGPSVVLWTGSEAWCWAMQGTTARSAKNGMVINLANVVSVRVSSRDSDEAGQYP